MKINSAVAGFIFIRDRMDIISCPIVNPFGITNFGLSISVCIPDESMNTGIDPGYLVKIFVDCCFLSSKDNLSLNSFVAVIDRFEDLNIENMLENAT